MSRLTRNWLSALCYSLSMRQYRIRLKLIKSRIRFCKIVINIRFYFGEQSPVIVIEEPLLIRLRFFGCIALRQMVFNFAGKSAYKIVDFGEAC